MQGYSRDDMKGPIGAYHGFVFLCFILSFIYLRIVEVSKCVNVARHGAGCRVFCMVVTTVQFAGALQRMT